MPKADCVHSTPPTNTAIASILEKLKREAAAEIDRLIAFIDMVDGYTMGEQEADAADDEPFLGWTRAGALGDGNDLEIDEVAA